jgi:hypothetical protein
VPLSHRNKEQAQAEAAGAGGDEGWGARIWCRATAGAALLLAARGSEIGQELAGLARPGDAVLLGCTGIKDEWRWWSLDAVDDGAAGLGSGD